jgi:hypothetical protein
MERIHEALLRRCVEISKESVAEGALQEEILAVHRGYWK